jgi:hypothetical protein
MMKHIRVIAVLIFLQTALCAFDTSSFWRKSLNETGDLHFQTYAGNQHSIQAIKKSIGIFLAAQAGCTISYSALLARV